MNWPQQQSGWGNNPSLGIQSYDQTPRFSRAAIGAYAVVLVIVLIVAFVFTMNAIIPFMSVKHGPSAVIGIGATIMTIAGFVRMDKLMGIK